MRNIFNIITDPGDKFEARVTPTCRQVINIKKGDVKNQLEGSMKLPSFFVLTVTLLIIGFSTSNPHQLYR